MTETQARATLPAHRDNGSVAHADIPQVAQISRAMVALYKDLFGRGPTRINTHWCGSDILVCVLEETLTTAERTLKEMGEHRRLLDTRMLFQYSKVDRFVAPVERITGRQVRSFIAGIDTNKDISIGTFLLESQGDAPND